LGSVLGRPRRTCSEPGPPLCEIYALLLSRAGLGDSLSKQFRCPAHPDRRCGTVSTGYPPDLPSGCSCTSKESFRPDSWMSKAPTFTARGTPDPHRVPLQVWRTFGRAIRARSRPHKPRLAERRAGFTAGTRGRPAPKPKERPTAYIERQCPGLALLE